MGYIVLINRDAGTVLKAGEDTLRKTIEDTFGENLERLEFLHPYEITDAVKKVSPDSDLLVGGGDGTITCVATALIAQGTSFGIIPLGTMNLFAHDLGIPVPWDAAVKAYAHNKVRHVDAGSVNGEIFLCNAMFGITTPVAKERENVRKAWGVHKWLRLSSLFLDKLTNGKSYRIKISSGNKKWECRYKAMVVANNKYRENTGLIGNSKESLEDGKLAVYVINPQGALESASFMAKMAAGGWQNEPHVDSFESEKVVMDEGKRSMPILLDGELKTLQAPLKFEVRPGALAVLVPEPQDA